jgi:hypothetical protein
MTLRSTLVAVALLGATLATTGAPAQDKKSEDQSRQQASQWPEFQSPERGFAVAFPSKPEATSAAVAGQNPLVRYSFESYEGGDTVYRVVVLEYPPGRAPDPLDEAFYVRMVSAYAKDSASQVRRRGPATIAGRPGFEAITDDGRGKVNHIVSIVPAGDRIFMLITAGPRGHAASDGAEHFRDSFRVIDSAPQTTGSTSSAPPSP